MTYRLTAVFPGWALGSSPERSRWLVAHDLAKERQGVPARDFDDLRVGIASSDKPADNVLTFGRGIDSSDESCTSHPDAGIGPYGHMVDA